MFARHIHKPTKQQINNNKKKTSKPKEPGNEIKIEKKAINYEEKKLKNISNKKKRRRK